MKSVLRQKYLIAYAPPTARLIAVATERFVMGSPVSNPGFPGVDVYEDEF